MKVRFIELHCGGEKQTLGHAVFMKVLLGRMPLMDNVMITAICLSVAIIASL